MFFWKKNKFIDSFAETISDELYSQVQPEVMRQYFSRELDKKQNKHVENILLRIETQISRFRLENKLGVYGKARLQLTLMERLEKLGYEKNVIKKVNEHILLKTAKY